MVAKRAGKDASSVDSGADIGKAHPPLRNAAATELRKAILAGRYKPGERLVEDRLAQEFGVSRNPVREALRVLAAEGLVEIRPRRGAMVAVLSHEMACEMIEVRATLEGLNARLAARRRDIKLIAAIRKVLEDGRVAMASGRIGQIARCSARFHDLLAEAGNNNVLGEMMRSLRDRTSLMFVSVTGEKAAQSWLEHEQIIQKVIAGDEQMAELLAARHVFHAGQRYLHNTECGQCARGFPQARRPQGCANVADVGEPGEPARALADGTGSYEIGAPQSRAIVRNRGRKQGGGRALLRSE